MSSYRVTWEIDLDADTPREAAERALAIHRDPQSWATVFDVFDGETGAHDHIDLDDDEEDDGLDHENVVTPPSKETDHA